MEDFEKLGVFYLGRDYDLAKRKSGENLLLYESKDLTTHAVCVGMTGSGKTGLCIGLLEEAAIDGIPAIVVDPKGDLSNLMLTFPDFSTDDFLPWINEDDARKKGLKPKEYAEKQAELWKTGLGKWGQDGGRIRRLREAADFAIYTPGSSAGIPVSILKSFEAPEPVILEDSDLLRERINTTVTGLLNLLGIDADPIQSREHILLSTILDASWRQGQGLDLARFIQAIQAPPVTRVGVFDLDSFFPAKDRFALAMQLNNLLAAPGFQAWLEGEALDVDRMLYTEEGKPRVAIFSIAHLSDTERMFFVSLLLTQVLGWMRSQSGTTSLRSLFYMDEIFGYMPPVANPPSKGPLLTLLKQARAFGLGVVLATQNPVDLDYKGLSNTGTWFIGRLQTDRDKQRVLDGLEGAGSSEGGKFDRQKMEQTLAGLGSRVFLMNNVHEDAPVIFETRWVMSYLRGPLTRDQIKTLMDPIKAATPTVAAKETPKAAPTKARARKAPPPAARPMLPPEVPQFFLPVRGSQPEGATLFYEPMLLGIARIYYANAKAGIATDQGISLLAELSDRISKPRWEEAEDAGIGAEEVEKTPEPDVMFGEVPKAASNKRNYAGWSRGFQDWLYRNQSLQLLKSPSLKILSNLDEPERDFRIRLQQASHERRDQLVERIREKYASKIGSLEERIRKAELAVEREQEQAKQQKLQTAISVGATLFGALLGRKKVSRTGMGRATTAARSAGRILKEKQDIERAQENVEALQQNLAELQAQLSQETEEAKNAADPLTEELEPVEIRPKKKDISVHLLALAWTPYWLDDRGGMAPAR